ncbi:MAG: CHASE domain-containing protein [Bacteroidales bacterium]|nr:CHASE domain-containing protein [Bacteroidales bacterium]
MKKNINPRQIRLQPIIIALIVFASLITATITYTQYVKGLWEKDLRADMITYMTGKKSNLEKALYSRIYYTRGIAAYVALNPEITNDEFTELAREYFREDTVINSLALSKNCILNAIYPYKGHEAAIGLNLLDHSERKEIVKKTIDTHLTFVAGPVELVEGGIAFISYTPIFDKTKENTPFWGMTDIVIKQNSLLNEALLKQTDTKYSFALRGYNGTGKTGDIFWGNPQIFDNNPVIIDISLPIGNWTLAAIPTVGWDQYPDQDKALLLILIVSTIIISILIWLFSRALLRIKINERELKAIFNSLDSLIIEYSDTGEYIKIGSQNKDLLFLPEKDLVGKNIYDIFEKEKANLFLKAIQKCIEHKKLVIIEYPLDIKGKELWFSARISYKSEHSIIFNAYDITEKRNKQLQLEKSEQKLSELNQMKDRFFSIIAHDLRSPLSTQKSIIDFMLEDYQQMDSEQQYELLQTVQNSSTHLYNLLESLLSWAMTQTDQIKVKMEPIQLYSHFEDLISQFSMDARMKDIVLYNELDTDARVIADPNLTGTILRNLLSNAIKFTERKGEVRIISEQIQIQDVYHQKISVTDTGKGFDPKRMEYLFRIDKTESTPGTENERGSGLGLILCQEFAKKQGSEITVANNTSKGSIFSFILPCAN